MQGSFLVPSIKIGAHFSNCQFPLALPILPITIRLISFQPDESFFFASYCHTNYCHIPIIIGRMLVYIQMRFRAEHKYGTIWVARM